jgi:hypothetical protein
MTKTGASFQVPGFELNECFIHCIENKYNEYLASILAPPLGGLGLLGERRRRHLRSWTHADAKGQGRRHGATGTVLGNVMAEGVGLHQTVMPNEGGEGAVAGVGEGQRTAAAPLPVTV